MMRTNLKVFFSDGLSPGKIYAAGITFQLVDKMENIVEPGCTVSIGDE